MVNSADFNVQSGSLTRLGKVSEEIFRNPNRLQRMTSAWLKRIQPARKCKDGPCYGDSSQGANNPKPCLERLSCENKIHRKLTFKQSHPQVKSPTKNDSPSTLSSSLKQMLGKMVRNSPCAAGNPSCEREKAVPTNISHRCPTGLRCPKKRNQHGAITNRRKLRVGSYQNDANSWRTEKETTSLRAARECPFGLWCLENEIINENEKAGMNIKGKLENDNSHGKLICGHGFDCEESSDDTSAKLEDVKQNKDEGNCPIGLWCSTKRELGYESSSTLKKCPPGLWCKRNDIKFSKDTRTKRVNTNYGKEGCPSGFQCSLRREEGYENFENMNQCPPGLWCKRSEIKREDHIKESKIDKEFFPAGLKRFSKREVGYENSVTLRRCPPGLWCKKDMIAIVTKHDKTEQVHCPNGYKCSSKRLVDYENSEILDECPPGLWCKRGVLHGGRIFKENIRKKEDYCSTGPWCDLKRHVANPTRHVLDECPPGLWCKRNAGKLQAAPNQTRERE